MGEQTAISWTDKTWNPWMGCQKVSQGCKHCYMYTEQARYGNDPSIVRRSKTRFRDPLKWKDPAMVFTCSWSDWFIEDADQWRAEAWEIIRTTPHLTYQILTKRPENIIERLPADWGEGYPNVWLGVSVESQLAAEARISTLLKVPARVRFLSCEPLLGPLDLTPWLLKAPGPDWVIVGGESGKGHRPIDLDWARQVRDDCTAAGVAFHFKQVGGVHHAAGGRLLDGREWLEFPNDRKAA